MVRITIPFTLAATILASNLALCTSTGLLQMSSYIKRHPNFTQNEFWYYWYDEHAPKVAPLATYFNISRYQQVRVSGQILPTLKGAPKPSSYEPVDFDGIAMFLFPSDEVLADFVSHPYYKQVVEPDEHIFIDKTAPGSGQVAVFSGRHFEVVNDRTDVWVGDSAQREKYQELFNSYL